MSAASDLPEAKVTWWDARSISARCPYCERIHRHDFVSTKYEPQQYRISPCSRGSYLLAFPLSPNGDGYDVDKRRALFVTAGEDAAEAEDILRVLHDLSGRRKWSEATEMVRDEWGTQKRMSRVISALAVGDVKYVRQYLESSSEADLFLHGVGAHQVTFPGLYGGDSEVESEGQVQTITHGKTALIMAAEEQFPEMVKLLLDFGADPNVGDIHGQTPLMAAAMWGRLETVKILLKKGADKQLECTGKGRFRHRAVDFARPLPINSEERNAIYSPYKEDTYARDLDRRQIAYLLDEYIPYHDNNYERGTDKPIFILAMPGDRETSLSLFASFEVNNRSKTMGVLWRGPKLPVKAAMSRWGYPARADGVPKIDEKDYLTEVFKLCKLVGHSLAVKPNRDRGEPGRFHASHAEKQLVAYLVSRHRFLPDSLPDIASPNLADGRELPVPKQELSNSSSELADLAGVVPPVTLKNATIMVSSQVCDDCKLFLELVNKCTCLGVEIEVLHHCAGRPCQSCSRG